jgi:hypothetical protein
MILPSKARTRLTLVLRASFTLVKFTAELIMILALGAVGSAHAKDVSSMYSGEVLSASQMTYRENVEWNWTNVLKAKLTSYERKRLDRVSIQLPLLGEGASRGNPFAIYQSGRGPGRAIVLPIMTLRFLDDLTIATAWLGANKYSLESLTTYVAYLKHASAESFAGGRFPQPLIVMGVTREKALADPKVDDVAQKLFKSLIVWLLAHELGHVLYADDLIKSNGLQEMAEQEADVFAMELMRRIGVAPFGIAGYFNLLSQWQPLQAEFPSKAHWIEYRLTKGVHPVSEPRLLNLSRLVEQRGEKESWPERYISRSLRQTADLVETGSILRPKTFDLDLLNPRRLGSETVTTKAAGTYTVVYEAYVQSTMNSPKFDLFITTNRLGDDTRFRQCLQMIMQRVESRAIEQSQLCQSYVTLQAKTSCYRENVSVGIFWWAVDVQKVLDGKLTWQETKTGQRLSQAQQIIKEISPPIAEEIMEAIRASQPLLRPMFTCEF